MRELCSGWSELLQAPSGAVAVFSCSLAVSIGDGWVDHLQQMWLYPWIEEGAEVDRLAVLSLRRNFAAHVMRLVGTMMRFWNKSHVPSNPTVRLNEARGTVKMREDGSWSLRQVTVWAKSR